MTTIKFNPGDHYYTGRNGYYNAHGIEVLDCAEKVMISPLTKRGAPGRCDITIPKEHLAEFIAALSEFITPPDRDSIRVQKAYAYLCDTDEDSVADQICLIENYLSAGAAAGTGWDLCSHVDGVCVWEPLENTLTIRQFLESI